MTATATVRVDLKELAKNLGEIRHQICEDFQEKRMNGDQLDQAVYIWHRCITEMCDTIKATNPKFDRVEFRNECMKSVEC
jgi:hypothetical protein